jgi:hypothetical protein
MKMTYTILVEVSVDESSGPKLIDVARQHYRDTKAAGLTLNNETFQRRGAPPQRKRFRQASTQLANWLCVRI